MLYDGDTFEHEGHNFRVRILPDDDTTPPWDREDGHGPVSEWTRRDKRPGELVLASDRGSHRFYDFAAAVRIARRDGWRAFAAGPEVMGEKPGEIAAEAARANFEFLRKWCADQWSYVGVVVELLDDDGDDMGESESVWGVESDVDSHVFETAHNLATEILHRIGKAFAA